MLKKDADDNAADSWEKIAVLFMCVHFFFLVFWCVCLYFFLNLGNSAVN